MASDRFPLALRLVFGLLAVGVAWISVWMWMAPELAGAFGAAFATLNGAPDLPSPRHFGDTWQWIVGGLTLVLLISLVLVPRYARWTGVAWFLSIAILTVAIQHTYPDDEPWWPQWIPALIGMALVLLIVRLTRVQPNKRLKLAARVD